MVAKCHTITGRIGACEAAWNQSCRLPLSPCGLRFKLEPIYAVTKMDTVSFMQEVGNYCASSLFLSPHPLPRPPTTSPHPPPAPAPHSLLLTDKWCKAKLRGADSAAPDPAAAFI
ncbi:Uncharacterized protein DAT39_000237 [Clarias magur]|uniref:Uncharacterized protein n=1 Tax=Clarias magur TaxID=1594786 RepID=A0A8J4XLC1_CLAMG|nr:Uncharacterized protein DAT39_000237 [Clarias magur]